MIGPLSARKSDGTHANRKSMKIPDDLDAEIQKCLNISVAESIRTLKAAAQEVAKTRGKEHTALEVLTTNHPGRTQEEYRASLGRFGIIGDTALQPVYTLSGGQKSRLAFANIAMAKPNYLIMDEPTNHLDVETVEALGKALNKFNGGVVLVSHDEQLISLVCRELWVVKDRMVSNLEGGLEEYRKQVYKQLQLAA